MYSYHGKAEFFVSLLQSSVSHDPSEIIIIRDLVLNKYFSLLSMLILYNRCCFQKYIVNVFTIIFVETFLNRNRK